MDMTSQLVYQRVRNRVIEMLEWLIECESIPPDLGMNELINCWADWVPTPLSDDYFPVPVFSEAEQKRVRDVNNAVDKFCDVTPRNIVDANAALKLPEWSVVVESAKLALADMMARGRMPEDQDLKL